MSFRTATRIGAPGPGSPSTRGRSRAKRLLVRFVLPIVSVGALVGAVLLANVATSAATPTAPTAEGSGFTAPVSTAKCMSWFNIRCYTPAQYQAAYNLTSLYNGEATGGRPITGAGETIVITEAFGSPTIKNDLRVFDAKFHLPNPSFTIDKFGNIPAFDPNDPLMVGQAQEATLTVEYAHVFAPGASIVLAETAVNTPQVGPAGISALMNAEQTLINKGVGDVYLQTITVAENSFPGVNSGNYSSLLSLRYALQDASSHHVTLLAPSGDEGVTETSMMSPPYPTYKFKAATWPASDPLVTAVGGTTMKLNPSGERVGPDVAWSDIYGASGGGLSTVFSRPQYQNVVAGVVGDHRGWPDISMSGAPGAWAYYSFHGYGGPGWHMLGGSTEAAPMMAGIVALADQLAGHRLGQINSALYKLGELQKTGNQGTGIVNVTSGGNAFTGVKGYHASAGYNLVTGWGTINAAVFVPELARLG
jgi:subtilase family serine protease